MQTKDSSMKKLKKVSNIVLIAACVAVVSCAAVAVIAHFVTGFELSPTLTTAWFSFWGVEIIALATIKNCKTKHHSEDTEDIPDEEDFE